MRGSIKKTVPILLTIVGALGVIGTAVTAVKATPKALQQINEAKEEKGEELTKWEIVKTAAPVYVPSLIIGVSTITCIVGSQLLTKRNQAALASAYALLSNSYKEYRNKVDAVFGEGADEKVSAEIVQEKYDAEDVFITPDDGLCDLDNTEKILFYDKMSERYFETTLLALHNAEYHLNRNFALRGSAGLNEFYEFIGIPTTEAGEALGWDIASGYGWIDFSHKKTTLEDGLECCIISPVFLPDSYDSEL